MATMLLNACSSADHSSSYYGDLTETSVTDDAGQDIDSEKKEISIKFKDYINSNTVSGIELPHSYYYNQLNDSLKIAYDDLVNGMVAYREYITLSSSITEDDLIHLLNIIMTNCPEIFHVDFKYSYDLNVSGYIKNFYPEYNLPYSTYKEYKDSLETDRIKYCSDKNITEYDFIGNVFQSVEKKISTLPIERTPLEKNSELTGFYGQQIFSNKFTSLGASKFIQYYCNYMGIENLVVIGEPLTSSKYDFSSLNPATELKKTERDGLYTIEMDINKYHAWNVINVSGVWTNCDATYDAFAKAEYQATPKSFLCVPDEIIRQTRLLQINNDLLGLSPSCYSNNFHYNARTMNYIKSYSKEDVSYCIDAIIDAMYYNHPKNIVVQFESESNYIQFQNEFNSALAQFNQKNNNEIPKFQLSAEDFDLVIKIYDILYS